MLTLINKAPESSTIETESNKLGWWRARLAAEAGEKPLQGWTGFVYATKQEAENRIREYARKFNLPGPIDNEPTIS